VRKVIDTTATPPESRSEITPKSEGKLVSEYDFAQLNTISDLFPLLDYKHN